MKKFVSALSGLVVATSCLHAFAADDKAKIDERLTSARAVVREVMATPDKAIPGSILSGASCVVVIPSYKKAAFLVWRTVWSGRCDVPYRQGLERTCVCAAHGRKLWFSDWRAGD